MKKNNKKEIFCVVSNDADMIILLMNLKYIHNVFVVHKKSSCIEIINLGILLDCHTDKFGCSYNPKYDFMALNIMLGNDYTPKVQYITFDKLWSSYKETLYGNKKGLMYDKNNISREFLIDLICNIIKNTQKRFIKTFKLEKYNENLYRNYWDGYLWCIDTYNHGICTNYNYSYNYNMSPHPSGLLLSLYKQNKLMPFKQIKTKPICKELYSLLLIPQSVKKLLCKEYQNLIDNKKLHNNKLYGDEFYKCCQKYNKIIEELNKRYLENHNNIELKSDSIVNMNKKFIQIKDG